jgi:outer membrane protein OmpA-like peptidoglycan-associated protein
MIRLLRQRKPFIQNRRYSSFYCVLTLLFLFFSSFTFAQEDKVSEANADCASPIILTDTIYGPTNPPSGYGTINEFQDVLGNYYSFEKEHNTVWFEFTAPGTGTLSLDIIPQCIKDDYDFLIFKYTGNENAFCDNIKNKKLKPFRSVISRNDKTISSTTGLKPGSFSDFIHSGPGESYAKPLDIIKNETYYLVLDNVYPNGCGFTLILHYKILKPKPSLNITLLDSLSGEMINGNISINDSVKNVSSYNHIQLTNTGSYYTAIDTTHIYAISASAKGYFFKSVVYKPVPSSEVASLKIKLQKIVAGKHVTLENIYFYGNQDVFLPTSAPALAGLLKTMNENPNLKIEVQGHVNAPYNTGLASDTAWNRKLSVMRAKAISKYLSDNGISEDRLSYKGFGNSHMLFPYANTEGEMEKNRRVEILVISNEE